MNNGLTKRGKGNANDEWETPPWLFKALDAEFGFTFDAAASDINHLCKNYKTMYGGSDPLPEDVVFCNPPYSNIEIFVDASLGNGEFGRVWVMLLPAFIDKTWYRKLWDSEKVEWRPFRQRIRFWLNGKPGGSPFFGSVVAIVRTR